MYALSIQQPWAWAILHAGKDVENRTWWPKRLFWNRDILIHAGKKVDREGWDDVEDICGVRPPDDLATGALLGIVRFSEPALFRKVDSKWAGGPICFQLSNPRSFDEPIQCRGRLGFWEPKEWDERDDRNG